MARGTAHVTRTTKFFRAKGYMVDIVERRSPPFPGNPFGKTHDFIGIIDLIAFDEFSTVGIQVCGSDFSAHHKKITGTDESEFAEDNLNNALRWLECPSRRLELWGWRKLKQVKKDGSKGKKEVYKPRVRVYINIDNQLTYDDVEVEI